MKIIEVVPIAKAITKETLSYFSATDVPVGSLVTIPLRRKEVPAIVSSVLSLAEQKAQLKQADFSLRKLADIKPKQFLLSQFVEAAKKTATYYATTTGAVLSTLISKRIFSLLSSLPETITSARSAQSAQNFIIQASDEERYASYKSLIREEFAKKNSVFFNLPTIHEVKQAARALEKGIEEYTVVLHGSLSKKELIKQCRRLCEIEHPILIIATGQFLSLPRADIGAYILDRESSRSYKIQSRPYLDYRTFAEILAKEVKAKLIYGDLFLSVETMHRFKSGQFEELFPPKFRSLSTAAITTIDMREYKTTPKAFVSISGALSNLISETRSQNSSLFIYAARKGLAPVTICGDCGHLVLCRTCGATMILHGSHATYQSDTDSDSDSTSESGSTSTSTSTSASASASASAYAPTQAKAVATIDENAHRNFFLCHKCGERRGALELCTSCGSWKLVTLGIGMERLEKDIKNQFSDATVILLDKERAPTYTKANKQIERFYSTPGAILIGTEMALPYLDKQIDNVAIGSIDSLLGMADFRINEKMCSILLRARSLAGKTLLVQTRDPEAPIFDYALKGNLLDFYRTEIEMRKKFNYPPFSTLIKVTLSGNRETIIKEMALLKDQLAEIVLEIFPSFVRNKKGHYSMHGLIRVPAGSWPEERLVEKLRSLPPQWTIKIDPDSLL